MKIGLWRTDKGHYLSHKNGLSEEQVQFFRTLKVGDKLVVFTNDVREGERTPNLSLGRSILTSEVQKDAVQA